MSNHVNPTPITSDLDSNDSAVVYTADRTLGYIERWTEDCAGNGRKVFVWFRSYTANGEVLQSRHRTIEGAAARIEAAAATH